MPYYPRGNDYVAPGAVALDALEKMLLDREVKKRQALLDSIEAQDRERRRSREDFTFEQAKTHAEQEQADRARALAEEERRKARIPQLVAQRREVMGVDPAMEQAYREELANEDYRTVAPEKPDFVSVRTVGAKGQPVTKYLTREQAAAMGEIPEYREPKTPTPVNWQTIETEDGLVQIDPRTGRTRPVVGADGQPISKMTTNPARLQQMADQQAIAQWNARKDELGRVTDGEGNAVNFETFRDAIRQQYREAWGRNPAPAGPAVPFSPDAIRPMPAHAAAPAASPAGARAAELIRKYGGR